jgi:hypothetical protein
MRRLVRRVLSAPSTHMLRVGALRQPTVCATSATLDAMGVFARPAQQANMICVHWAVSNRTVPMSRGAQTVCKTRIRLKRQVLAPCALRTPTHRLPATSQATARVIQDSVEGGSLLAMDVRRGNFGKEERAKGSLRILA